MRNLCIFITVIFVLVISAAAAISTPRGQAVMIPLMFTLFAPKEPFHEEKMGEPPNYTLHHYWAGLPNRQDAADLVPGNTAYKDNQGATRADVFFIHGTGFASQERWTSPIDINSKTEENTDFSMANEASIFNSCCDVYVPRYRQASLFAYLAETNEREKILNAVYQDIEAAFNYFITHYNKGRPFIIAGHSQGTHHALRLIADRIDGTPSSARLVAAYTIGGMMIPVSLSFIDGLSTIGVCEQSDDTGCIIHWDTFQRGGIDKIFPSPEPPLCTNPLSWLTNEVYVDKSHHLGAAPISGSYALSMSGEDIAQGIEFDHLEAPMTQYTSAKCESGVLYIDDQSDQKYSELGQFPDGSVHGVDFAMFHMNIRENSMRRVAAFYRKQTSKR